MDRLKSMGSGKGRQRRVLLAEYLTSRKKQEGEEAREEVDMNWLQWENIIFEL